MKLCSPRTLTNVLMSYLYFVGAKHERECVHMHVQTRHFLHCFRGSWGPDPNPQQPPRPVHYAQTPSQQFMPSPRGDVRALPQSHRASPFSHPIPRPQPLPSVPFLEQPPPAPGAPVHSYSPLPADEGPPGMYALLWSGCAARPCGRGVRALWEFGEGVGLVKRWLMYRACC